MRTSLKGHSLPESEEDFNLLESQNRLLYARCQGCGKAFEDRVWSAAGWRETQISGFCEICWVEVFAEPDGEDDDA